MKEIKIIVVLVIACLLGVTSCDIDRLPETSLTDPSFWKSESDLKLASNYLYTFFPNLPVTSDVWSDDAYGTSTNSISDGSRLTPSSDGFYGTQYRLIRAANNIIEKSTLLLDEGVEKKIVDRYVGEARFFRAWGYYQLFQRYGGVPLILKTLTEDAPELDQPQASREEVIDVIYNDLDFASQNLPLPSMLSSDDYGRVTKTAAYAFKSRVALFEGTRSKFHNYGNATEHLTIAKSAALAVIKTGEHNIFNSYYQLFQYEGEGSQNKENIIVRVYGKSLEDAIDSHNSQRILEQGRVNPTKALADSYLMSDGLPMDKSPLYQQPSSINGVFENRDPRMVYSFLKTGDEYIGSQPTFNIPSLSFQRTGFANRRYTNTNDWSNQRSFIDYPILRYAEVLLNYAEATYELNESISDEDLNKSINKLRDREDVQLPALTNTFISINSLDMREEIRRERRVELALNGFRYWDLIRWKTAETELLKPVLGNYYFEEFGTQVTPELNAENYILLQTADRRFFDPERDYLWPFPVNQISLNPNLEQNPKW
ncbi:RagB/SusD family nutrient uptake outer membrane protein [Joostella atrarenae]|uniref:RagB/SusD family nutrient uptake outer membrane protein n=1 Tax=Joostella atrarenae TaxID=679257 RepID=A0ABS9J5B0_9FLAO|nr:RagB/SusD family nutrient uptake outer membrane protein [Joostella atrarenae]MCF8715615.1 RagB/SusD family nutrient uptake outer membrane protein [Joostella atrarenae]